MTEEIPTPEIEKKIEKKPILERMEAMTMKEVVDFFGEIKHLSFQSINARIQREYEKDGTITQGTFRIALRKVVSADILPSPSEAQILLDKIMSNK